MTMNSHFDWIYLAQVEAWIWKSIYIGDSLNNILSLDNHLMAN